MGLPSIPSYSMPTASDLPENKVSWKADPKRSVLLIHDMQKYFLGAFNQHESPVKELIANIRRIRDVCKAKGIPVVYTAQPGNQKSEDRALLQDFWGEGLSEDPSETSIVDELAPDKEDTVLTKWRYSAFKRTNLKEMMESQQRDQLMICGVYAHIGCLLTAAEAFMDDIQAFFIADAIADFSRKDHETAVNYAASRCGFAAASTTVLEQLQSNGEVPISKKHDDRLSYKEVKEQVAEILETNPEKIDDEANLISMGLDSIRMMSLVEEWREMGADVDFMKLAETPTLVHWWSLLSASEVPS
ncbi:isochorismatase [Halobacillus salinarum]|uniref:isochorismatase n=1 Tax=Halobacillus salinarum TaxID=2932257 RepID=A0ABY4EDR6_9BACI|nr:isochorismatase [Halobacillus salinarum]UOQ42593.1 isochorismatase [Halobacillus salinarum]